ncbi:unnamed protein product [Rotaria sordida]|uniref:Uncharacterized protein n=1 Tax=Rotaria sordida TaxID=392033 RepID=A0A819QN80_9BILA|nr:unnamed protein product [Rotaria sordida]
MEIAKTLLKNPVDKNRRDTLDKFLDDYYYGRLATRGKEDNINQLSALAEEYINELTEDEGAQAEQLATLFEMATPKNQEEFVKQMIKYALKCAKGEPLNRRNQLLDFLEDDDDED